MLKITGGDLKGRNVLTPSDLKTRPTAAKLRQALFNSIQFQVPDSRVLDLFSGSGSLGLEAYSRGAQFVFFAEQAPSAIKILEKNRLALGVQNQSKLIRESILSGPFLKRLEFEVESGGPFDLVLADPPYSENYEMKLLDFMPWEKILKPGGLFLLEWGIVKSKVESLPDETPFLVKVREKNYGDSCLTTFERKS